jgi:hypothetical protein
VERECGRSAFVALVVESELHAVIGEEWLGLGDGAARQRDEPLEIVGA